MSTTFFMRPSNAGGQVWLKIVRRFDGQNLASYRSGMLTLAADLDLAPRASTARTPARLIGQGGARDPSRARLGQASTASRRRVNTTRNRRLPSFPRRSVLVRATRLRTSDNGTAAARTSAATPEPRRYAVEPLAAVRHTARRSPAALGERWPSARRCSGCRNARRAPWLRAGTPGGKGPCTAHSLIRRRDRAGHQPTSPSRARTEPAARPDRAVAVRPRTGPVVAMFRREQAMPYRPVPCEPVAMLRPTPAFLAAGPRCRQPSGRAHHGGESEVSRAAASPGRCALRPPSGSGPATM